MNLQLNQLKKRTSGIIFYLMIAFLIGVMVVGCEEIREPDSLVIAVKELPNGLNPVLDINDEGRFAIGILFQGLFDPSGEKPNDFKPSLAKEITQDPNDRAVFEISLWQNVKWHDDRGFSADDVLFSYDCYTNPDNNSPLQGRIGTLIKKIEKVDDYHVRVTFVVPVSYIDVPFLLSFKIIPSFYQNKPMDSNLWTKTSLNFNRQPIGTGAYRFETWGNNELTLIQQDTTAQIKRIIIQGQRDVDIRVRKLIDNKIDMVFNVDPSFFDILNTQQLGFSEYVPYAYYSIAFNNNDALLSDIHLRHAMAFATDKNALLLEAYGKDNEAYINYGPFPHNSHKLYRGFEDKFTYNIDSAEAELQQSQYNGTPLTLIFPQEYGAIGEKTAYGFKHMMNEIGVQVEVVERGLDFYSALDGKTFQMALVYEDGFGRHYHINPIYLSNNPKNVTGIKDSELDDLLVEWSNEIIMTKKVPIAKALHEKISEICPYTYLFTPPQRAYYSKRLRNVSIVDANSLLASIHKWEISLDE